jgi:hypothetical protein
MCTMTPTSRLCLSTMDSYRRPGPCFRSRSLAIVVPLLSPLSYFLAYTSLPRSRRDLNPNFLLLLSPISFALDSPGCSRCLMCRSPPRLLPSSPCPHFFRMLCSETNSESTPAKLKGKCVVLTEVDIPASFDRCAGVDLAGVAPTPSKAHLPILLAIRHLDTLRCTLSPLQLVFDSTSNITATIRPCPLLPRLRRRPKLRPVSRS